MARRITAEKRAFEYAYTEAWTAFEHVRRDINPKQWMHRNKHDIKRISLRFDDPTTPLQNHAYVHALCYSGKHMYAYFDTHAEALRWTRSFTLAQSAQWCPSIQFVDGTMLQIYSQSLLHELDRARLQADKLTCGHAHSIIYIPHEAYTRVHFALHVRACTVCDRVLAIQGRITTHHQQENGLSWIVYDVYESTRKEYKTFVNRWS
jgi:hypothetical protein